MGFGFFKSKQKGSSSPPSSPTSSHTSRPPLQRKNSRTSAPTNPSPRHELQTQPRALSFDGPFYKTLDPKADDGGAGDKVVKESGISKGFLDDVLGDFDKRFNLVGDESREQSRRAKKYKFDLVEPKPQLQAYTPKVYRLGDSSKNEPPTSKPTPSSSTSKPTTTTKSDASTEVRSIFRKIKTDDENRGRTPGPSSPASRQDVRFNRQARQNPDALSRQPSRGRKSQDQSRRGKSLGRNPTQSSGTESDESEEDNIPINQTKLATNARSLSRPRKGIQVSPRDQSLGTKLSTANLRRQPSPTNHSPRGRSVGPPTTTTLPSPPPSSGSGSTSTDSRSQTRSRSRMGRPPATPDNSSDSDSDSDAPLAGVRQQAIADSIFRGRRRGNVRGQSVEARAPSVDQQRSRSVDIAPGRSRKVPDAPPPPTDKVLPNMAAAQQQQQMWAAAYYQQAAAYQQMAFQQMQHQQQAGMGMQYNPMMMYGMMPGMIPQQQPVKRKKSLKKKKSMQSVGVAEAEVAA